VKRPGLPVIYGKCKKPPPKGRLFVWIAVFPLAFFAYTVYMKIKIAKDLPRLFEAVLGLSSQKSAALPSFTVQNMSPVFYFCALVLAFVSASAALLFLPYALSAHTGEIESTLEREIRSSIEADALESGLSEAEIDTLVHALADSAAEDGVTSHDVAEESSFLGDGGFGASSEANKQAASPARTSALAGLLGGLIVFSLLYALWKRVDTDATQDNI